MSRLRVHSISADFQYRQYFFFPLHHKQLYFARFKQKIQRTYFCVSKKLNSIQSVPNICIFSTVLLLSIYPCPTTKSRAQTHRPSSSFSPAARSLSLATRGIRGYLRRFGVQIPPLGCLSIRPWLADNFHSSQRCRGLLNEGLGHYLQFQKNELHHFFCCKKIVSFTFSKNSIFRLFDFDRLGIFVTTFFSLQFPKHSNNFFE